MGDSVKKTHHYSRDRAARERLIKDVIGYGEEIDRFTWDKGHPNGPEIHVITSTGIIVVYNAITNRLVTTLIARPAQIQRYYEKEGRKAPAELMKLALEHQEKGYNNL